MTDRNKPGLETGAKVFWGVIIAFAALAFYGWASGGWDRGYERERIKRIERGRRLKISADRNAAIIEKMSPEERRAAESDYWRDAPIGRTIGGDTY
jgi:hypothetical protein